jgi:hypothetical protein
VPRRSAFLAWGSALASVLVLGCAPAGREGEPHQAFSRAGGSCDLRAATPWISKWLTAWELTSTQILRLPDPRPVDLIFYDSACVYTTSALAAPGAAVQAGPTLFGVDLPWHALAHHDTIIDADSSRRPVRMSATGGATSRGRGFLVMSGPEFWVQGGGVTRDGLAREETLTGVVLHEFAHAHQVPALVATIDSIASTWSFPQRFNDDVVQARFGADSAYVRAYMAERDLLYRAASADSMDDVRALAGEALAMMRSRHARWFSGENRVFATLDDLFLSLEGAGQWTGYAWLAHRQGAGFHPHIAVAIMRGRGRVWAQDQGLALFLVVNRLLPEWPSLVFGPRSIGALELLQRAVEAPS